MMFNRIKNYLDIEDAPYQVINHLTAFTAQETAAVTHTPGKEFAKTVIIRSHDELIMLVLPACYKLDFKLLRKAIRKGDIRLAQEEEFKNIFPDCAVGAMPPFGNIYGLDVYVEEELTKDDNIAFNGGSHDEVIKMPYREFERIVKPRVCHISY
ncbi:MAG: deacylase [Omnitrophica WOR_2 bacterium RIFOXYB2_FULL_38_16]|nr:MAG: deacylase [Omnitrophica WOR_2 bacterium RIFOXYA2_FULL_38_17]OGX53935.1 MAG: deacylase [Omnitrophica WOR_2 bacterium RIFOXYA12_FULL_38_10]OGX59885.1 MAG: deacylase [Omnitrophica WOR_2 bacterium RIFOXYB2_FULL_38_16]HBG60498.1 deacylase [Candidatus Omnitrophota bacterium]